MDIAKRALRRVRLYHPLSRWLRPRLDWLRLPTGATVLIHVGRCGGSSLRQGLANATHNQDVHVVHICKPPYRTDLNYIVLARNPIARLRSAFRHRRRLVIDEAKQADRFAGERAVLQEYASLSDIAEALYLPDGSSNVRVQRQIRRIHHILEDIDFYLGDLLRQCRPDQIAAVLMQESLDEDIARVFGYKNEIFVNAAPAAKVADELSPLASANLKRHFAADYRALMTLGGWGKIAPEVLSKAIQATGRFEHKR